MRDADLSQINDWSVEGRKQYLEEHRVTIEVILSNALEEFYGPKLSSVFGCQDKAKDKILDMFVSERLDQIELRKRNIPCDLGLFDQIDFWCKFKTGISVKGIKQISLDSNLLDHDVLTGNDIEHDIEKLSNCLPLYSHSVAPDMVGYWLLANKKLLDELSGFINVDVNVAKELKGSPAKLSKYKADASFRYLCLYLNVESKVSDFHKYQKKYLTRGENKPQYVADGNESHMEKHEVRKSVAQVIDHFHRVNNDGTTVLCHKLFKSAGRKSLLDQYEIGRDFAHYEKLKNQLSELKSPRKEEA
ncbi:hypothetical protein ACU440_002159 [Vibrio alginolyticus]|uniref:hypothetical protein n=1 Tax=Vibrio TaxID=662 RepID=UPI001122EB88|nr:MULTISPECIES: hypothetical protein [Vibrio]EII3282794.1 hypothetical protein [Vibrio alginolyticus]EJN3357168.1 hypothetical protein [Vibrio alginolyticus]EJS0369030.1 hypothetical protein [Vibrio alginolyticus]ELA7386367.1 hypothetical protein [Vibrio alginolyticus]ELB2766024.1 hypothetical protein [Vibrio alginolyticus]